MRKNLALLTGLAALALVVAYSGVFAGGSHCMQSKEGVSSASASSASCPGGAGMKAGADGAHCTMAAGAACCPFDRTAFEKQAPGTTMDIQMSKTGATLTITAASAQYVAAVQTMAAASFEGMKTQLASASSMSSGAGCPAHAGATKTGATKASMNSGACPAGAQTMSMGAGCCAGDKSAMKAEKASGGCPMSGAGMTGMCETVKSGLCCSECTFEKTSNGARISWTSPKAEVVKSVQTAAAHMKNCLSGMAQL